MLLNDRRITELCQGDQPMISPFSPEQVTQAQGIPLVSSGLSSAGYDIKIGRIIKVFHNPYLRKAHSSMHMVIQQEPPVIDPKNFDTRLLHETLVEGDHFILPPGGYCLANAPERMHLPRNVAGVCLTKSTYARCGLLVNVTPLEPGWQGYLTLELANLTCLPLKVYVDEGIAQIMFHQIEQPEVSYADRKGKYQDQPATPVAPRMQVTK